MQDQRANFVATDTTFRIGLFDRHDGTVQNVGGILGRGTRQRQVDPDGHVFGLRVSRAASHGER